MNELPSIPTRTDLICFSLIILLFTDFKFSITNFGSGLPEPKGASKLILPGVGAFDWAMHRLNASGLRPALDDLVLDHEYPHLIQRPHPWRRLKTKASERLIPLVGYSLWAVQQASQHSTTNFLFPRYSNETECKANSASAALNKWLKPKVPKGCVIHSFRHSFRDRLRAVECPSEIVDRLGGWSVGGVGESYGSGYPIDVLHKWMERAVSI